MPSELNSMNHYMLMTPKTPHPPGFLGLSGLLTTVQQNVMGGAHVGVGNKASCNTQEVGNNRGATENKVTCWQHMSQNVVNVIFQVNYFVVAGRTK